VRRTRASCSASTIEVGNRGAKPLEELAHAPSNAFPLYARRTSVTARPLLFGWRCDDTAPRWPTCQAFRSPACWPPDGHSLSVSRSPFLLAYSFGLPSLLAPGSHRATALFLPSPVPFRTQCLVQAFSIDSSAPVRALSADILTMLARLQPAAPVLLPVVSPTQAGTAAAAATAAVPPATVALADSVATPTRFASQTSPGSAAATAQVRLLAPALSLWSSVFFFTTSSVISGT